MATIYHNLSDYDPALVPDGTGRRFALVVSEWNSDVTHAMANGAHALLLQHGVSEEDIDLYHVPGSFELIYGSAKVIQMQRYDAVIAIGCIVRGETPHFDYISQAVGIGLGKLNTEAEIPVIFGVLTTDTMEQALDRAGGRHGNKGDEAAVTALKMVATLG